MGKTAAPCASGATSRVTSGEGVLGVEGRWGTVVFQKKTSSRGGDGKGMQAAHPGRGAKCWLCPLDVADTATLGAQATLTSYFIPFT